MLYTIKKRAPVKTAGDEVIQAFALVVYALTAGAIIGLAIHFAIKTL